jgi:hypothetical protein
MIEVYRAELISKLRSVMLHAPLCNAAADEIEDLIDENKRLLKQLGDLFRSTREGKL